MGGPRLPVGLCLLQSLLHRRQNFTLRGYRSYLASGSLKLKVQLAPSFRFTSTFLSKSSIPRIFPMSIFGTLPDIQRLSDRVIRIMGGNPGKFTLQGSNTYLVGTGDKRILIDTGAGAEHWIRALKKALADEKAEVSTALVTHWHHDHVRGIPDLKKISPGTVVYKNQPSAGQEDIVDGQVFSVEGATITAHYTPGHTVDHMCFFLSEESALFTGDNVLGHGTTVFEELASYMSSLRRMREIPGLSGRGYPGHGDVLADVKDVMKGYIEHRMARERQVLMVMKEGHPLGGDDAMTAMEIVQVIYKGVPRELWPAAAMGMVLILEKLEKERRVVREGERWVLSERAGLS